MICAAQAVHQIPTRCLSFSNARSFVCFGSSNLYRLAHASKKTTHQILFDTHTKHMNRSDVILVLLHLLYLIHGLTDRASSAQKPWPGCEQDDTICSWIRIHNWCVGTFRGVTPPFDTVSPLRCSILCSANASLRSELLWAKGMHAGLRCVVVAGMHLPRIPYADRCRSANEQRTTASSVVYALANLRPSPMRCAWQRVDFSCDFLYSNPLKCFDSDGVFIAVPVLHCFPVIRTGTSITCSLSLGHRLPGQFDRVISHYIYNVRPIVISVKQCTHCVCAIYALCGSSCKVQALVFVSELGDSIECRFPKRF